MDSIIAQFIDHRLSNNFNGCAIVSGLDRSGKSTMSIKLANKYRYSKFSYKYGDEYSYNWKDARYIQIFDRCPLLEFYAYGDMKLSNECDLSMRKEAEYNYIKSHLKYFNNPIFIIYLHNLWDNGDQPKSFYENKDKILNRYIDIVEILKNLNQQVIVCTEHSIRQYNILYNAKDNLPDEGFKWY